MDLRTAALVLRSALPKGSLPIRWATRRVLRAAASGAPGVTRPLARAVRSQGAEAVWRAWLDPAVSGPAPARWSTPAVPLLLETATPVPDAVVDAAWHDWLNAHDPALWSLLEGWARAATPTDPRTWAHSRLALSPTPTRARQPEGGSGAMPEEKPGKAPVETPSEPQPQDTIPLPSDVLADAALRFTHPLGERARARLLTSGDPEAVDLFCAAAVDRDVPEAIAFCVARGLAPAGEVERVVFFVRTGQHSHYRALDPDGVLLALGYRGAPSEERSALREAMTGLGGLDVLRVLAGDATQPTATALDEQERAYAVRQLTDRRDWAGL
ncbi:hypothetical protein QQY66_37830 [Streptomyces sp. DG2A-72]|uniref:hypothetical protein n=1 Tax=Streptomyces sp. DG2A-72 TaxID=3051386 RepID=UPI00265C025C|nr:hypothetical protein [Streptomyces sp. DG2A-72]MDO0937202.1 hypothetical protein [Streptomyces sp. DG2A-72]